jgi:NADP-dependent 3-hydroxy acid dehydrogenase YdfG
MSLKNKIAVITGASRGIGKAIALDLARSGVYVILVSRNEDDLKAAVSSILKEGGKASAFNVDITDEAAVLRLLNSLSEICSHVDILVNNAGVGSFQPVTETDSQSWDQVMDVNVKGTFLMCKHLLPMMKTGKHGHIISIASDVAKRTFANGAMYCASKYAQDAFCSALRKEVRPFNIKVSVVYPGLVETFFNNNVPGENKDQLHLNPEDIADTVNYILSAPAHVVIDELMIHPISQEY